MKYLILTLFLVASVSCLQKNEFGTGFPDSWYEEEANNAGDDGLDPIPHFLDADEDFSGYFGESPVAVTDPKNVLQVAYDAGATIFVKAALLVGLKDDLSNLNNITAFVPSNRAFARLPKLVYLYFLRHPSKLRALLKYHVIHGTFQIEDLQDDNLYGTLLGNLSVRFDQYNHTRGNHTTHVIQGAHINNCKINLEASNGIVQIIDDIILRVSLVSTHRVIAKAPVFGTLYDALIVAGLADSFRNGSQTLFAPTEKAFQKLPRGVWEKLLADKDALTKVLDLHILTGTYFIRGLHNNDILPSLNKDTTLTIHVRHERAAGEVSSRKGEWKVFVNDAEIVWFDGATTTGVIHAIDTVLIPASILDGLMDSVLEENDV